MLDPLLRSNSPHLEAGESLLFWNDAEKIGAFCWISKRPQMHQWSQKLLCFIVGTGRQETVQGLCGLAKIILEPFNVWHVCWPAVLFSHSKGMPVPAALCTGEKLGLIHFRALERFSNECYRYETVFGIIWKNTTDSTPSIRTFIWTWLCICWQLCGCMLHITHVQSHSEKFRAHYLVRPHYIVQNILKLYPTLINARATSGRYTAWPERRHWQWSSGLNVQTLELRLWFCKRRHCLIWCCPKLPWRVDFEDLCISSVWFWLQCFILTLDGYSRQTMHPLRWWAMVSGTLVLPPLSYLVALSHTHGGCSKCIEVSKIHKIFLYCCCQITWSDWDRIPPSHLRMTTLHSHGQSLPVHLQAPLGLNLKN